MNFKCPVCLLATVFLATVSPAEAQQAKKIPRIAYVTGLSDASKSASRDEAFWQRFRDLGYSAGKNVLIEYRYLEGNTDAYPQLMTELVGLKVDVLVVAGSLTMIRLAKQATKTIPIVIVTTQDPVRMAIVDSLARPGGNITGVTTLLRELSGKRLEILKESVPRISRVAVLGSATQLRTRTDGTSDIQWYEEPARALKLQLEALEVKPPNPDFEGAFQSAAKGKANALITVSGSLLTPHLKRIAELAIKYRLPSMHERQDYVEAGGLMSYAASETASYARAAEYVDRILKGTKPADLPVEQPIKFEYIINLKTANALRVTIPQWTLMKADKVIR